MKSKCPKCDEPFDDSMLSAEFYDAGGEVEIDLKLRCKGCGALFYTFVPIANLEAE